MGCGQPAYTALSSASDPARVDQAIPDKSSTASLLILFKMHNATLERDVLD